MKLVWFLTIATILSTTLGEFGQFPFGNTTFSISLTDILLTLSVTFLLIWKIAIKKNLILFYEMKVLMLFWIIGLISLILSGNLGGIAYLVRFILYSSSLALGYFLIKDETRPENLFKTIILSGLILSLLGFTQLIFYPDLEPLTSFGFDPHKNRLASTFLDPNFLGAFLNIPLLLCLVLFFKTKQKGYLISSAVIVLAIILTFSRSAYLMTVAEVFILGLFKDRRIILASITLFIISFIFIPSFSQRIQGGLTGDASSSERIYSWQRGLTIFRDNPILGVGFNNLRHAFDKSNLFKQFSSDGGNSGAGVDSSFIFVLATTGVVGFITYLYWWLLFLRSSVKNFIKKSEKDYVLILCLVPALFINSQFINSLFYPPIMLITFLILGGLKAKNYEI